MPTDVTVLGTSQCTATVLNLSSTLVNWSVSGTGNGSITTTGGLYTAPSAVPTNNVITITATSQVQASLTATESLTIQAATAITQVICNDSSGKQATSVSSGNKLACTAYSSATTGTTVPVNWTVASGNNLGGNIGSISAQGVYTAPLLPPPGQTVTITATSQALATETMSVTATVVFGNAVLSGPYVFYTKGMLPASNSFWARAGSFTAGGGNLTGIEDTNQGGAPNIVTPQRSFTGSYSIGSDGRGTMQFCENLSPSCPTGSSSATAFFRIVVVSPNQAEIVEVPPSGNLTAGGEMILQDPSVSGAGAKNLSGAYSYSFSGVSTIATEESVVGDFVANGFGNISLGTINPTTAPGEMDTEIGGQTPAQVALPATTYSVPASGRGTVALNGLTFSFYPISASRSKFIEIDQPPSGTTTPDSILVGDAYLQQTTLSCGWNLNALNGSAVFETSGMNTTGGVPGVAIGDVGSFTASNNGTAGAASSPSIDENSGGTVSSQVGTLPSGSYTMDPCGRGTLTIGSNTYTFFIISASDAVLQETTSGIVAHGFLVPSQGGPFANSTLTGSYAFRMSGTDAAGTAGNREDFLGQVASTGSGTGLAGTLDLNDFGVTQTGVVIANGTYLPAGSLRATMTVPLATTPSATTRNLVLYMVSPTLFYALDTDPAPAGTAIGEIYDQF